MIIETDKLKRILPNCRNPEMWSFELSVVLDSYGISTKEQVAMFLAQVGHESMDLNVMQENLNYSADGLRKVFGKYFPTTKLAANYARQPEWIASRVYANRMGNGNEQSREGWKYRGRGILQLTGKSNYMVCSMDLFGDYRLVDNPDLLLDSTNAMLSACWYWKKNNLNRYSGNIRACTKAVNGGYNGLDHRTAIYKRALEVL